ncbi:MAG: hypothetical protein HZA52_04375 [Planctomycetes bacterium]|nr:hypothetical protein [Planctomycetota bacterium]
MFAACSLDFDPVSGDLFAVIALNAWSMGLYRVDAVTGHAALVGRIGPTFDGYSALAIDARGRAFVTGSQNPHIYSLNLQTAEATLLGGLGLGAGDFMDLASSADGTLWGAYRDAGQGHLKTGLYVIDIANVAATKVVDVQYPGYVGLTFVPAPPSRTYCEGKPNSLGCVPSISSSGWPSPTAKSGYAIQATDVINHTIGVLLVGTQGKWQRPFEGGTLCLQTPFDNFPLVPSQGSPPPAYNCSGVLWIDFNTILSWGVANPALYQPGTAIQCQWLARDRRLGGSAEVSLSNALEFVLQP